jgi:hypothetical protein
MIKLLALAGTMLLLIASTAAQAGNLANNTQPAKAKVTAYMVDYNIQKES